MASEVPRGPADQDLSDDEVSDDEEVLHDEDTGGYEGAAASYMRDAHKADAELQQALIDAGLSPEQQLLLQRLVSDNHERAAEVIQALQQMHEQEAEAEAAAAVTEETEDFLRTANELRQKLHTPLYDGAQINTLMAIFMLMEWRFRSVDVV